MFDLFFEQRAIKFTELEIKVEMKRNKLFSAVRS